MIGASDFLRTQVDQYAVANELAQFHMDMLIRLYALPPIRPPAAGCVLRKPLGAEHALIADWVARHFSPAWSSEAQAACANRPVSLFIATRADPAEMVGFCCYDATARGLVGPIGVAPAARRTGVGAALLRACLDDMRAAGYAYAVAGAVGAPDFFRRAAGAIEIPGSEPGPYQGMLRADRLNTDSSAQ